MCCTAPTTASLYNTKLPTLTVYRNLKTTYEVFYLSDNREAKQDGRSE